MNATKSVTLLLHTRNRPQFLYRALKHYAFDVSRDDISVVVSDGSDEGNWKIIRESGAADMANHVLHHDYDYPFVSRLSEAIGLVETPFVVLAADDDFYLTEWLGHAATLLESDSSIGILYGHTLKFWFPDFKPYGTDVQFTIDKTRNPAPRWLEDTDATKRLSELGRGSIDFATTGWYAMQRTGILRDILSHARKVQLSPFGLEKFIGFYHAAFWRTRMMDEIYLARQVNLAEKRAPVSFERASSEIAKLKELCSQLLVAKEGFSPVEASNLVDHVFLGEVEWMKRADKKRLLRTLADRAPILRTVWTAIGRAVPLLSTVPAVEIDGRFPKPPQLASDDPILARIRQSVA